jgi:hypothetical protein
MPANFDQRIDDLRNALKQNPWNPTLRLSAEEQTKLSWARVAKSRAEIPDAYGAFFDALPAQEKDPFPYTVISPTYRGFLQPENEKIICRIGGNIHVMEIQDRRLSSVCYPLADIILVEAGTILLSSWFMVHGRESRGSLATSTMKFNSVTEPLFAPFLEEFRLTARGATKEEGAAADTSPFDALADADFKFMNYARGSIQPGERTVQVILQPEIRKSFFNLTGMKLSRQITPAHLTILTDGELIFIREDNSQRRLSERRYGGVWRYIPLNKITSTAHAETENKTIILLVNLVGKGRLESVFDISQEENIAKLQKAIRTGAVS